MKAVQTLVAVILCAIMAFMLAPSAIAQNPGNDVAVEALLISNKFPKVGEPVTLTVQIKNVGTQAQTGRRAYLYIDPAQQPPTVNTPATTELILMGLTWPAGDAVIGEKDGYTFNTPGEHVIYAWVDPLEYIAESDERNNLKELRIQVGVADAFEANDSCSEAKEIPSDGTLQTHQFMKLGDIDWVKFQTVAGGVYTVTMTGLGNQIDPKMQLWSDCSRVDPTQPPDNTFGTRHVVSYQAPTSGWVYLRLDNRGPNYDPSQTAYSVMVVGPSQGGDKYEPNNSCSQANPIGLGQDVQAHAFQDSNDVDWVKFQATKDKTYSLQTYTPDGSAADVTLEVYDNCNGNPIVPPDNTFGSTVKLEFKSPLDGPLYLKASNKKPFVAGDPAHYQVTARQVEPDYFGPGAAIIVAGRVKRSDHLQPNIYFVTDNVYRMFLAHGYRPEDIMYLAPDKSYSANVDDVATPGNLKNAITNWAKDKVGPNRALNIYMMDHGDPETFHLDKLQGYMVSPTDLDSWLTALEANDAQRGLKVNLFIEACYAGSFIQHPQSVSKPDRLIVASAQPNKLSHASLRGAFFSDLLIGSLNHGENLYNSFKLAEEGTLKASWNRQQPWLDGNGNGVPNEEADFKTAALVSFPAKTFGNNGLPYIDKPQVDLLNRTLRVQIADDNNDITNAWVIIYPPSYQYPKDEGNEMIQESITPLYLSNQGNGQWGATYPALIESGTYRMVIYAEDSAGLLARPSELFAMGPSPTPTHTPTPITPTPTHTPTPTDIPDTGNDVKVYLPLIRK